MNIQEIIAPDVWPVTVEEAKEHARITHDSDDVYVQTCIEAATRHAEQYTSKSIAQHTWQAACSAFPGGLAPFKLPRPPVLTVESITYIPEYSAGAIPAAVTVPESVYDVRIFADDAHIIPSEEWPLAAPIPNSVIIEFTAGLPLTEDSPPALIVPANVKQAILIMVRDMYDNRADTVLGMSVAKLNTAENLLRPERAAIW